MSKTSDVINALKSGKSAKEIKEEFKVSDSLISRCKKSLDAMDKPVEEVKPTEEEAEPTDEEIEAVVKEICIKPEAKYLTKDNDKLEDDYHCVGCNHSWKSSSLPKSCPNCGCEF